MKKPELDFSATLPHHSDVDAEMKIAITESSDGPVMLVDVDGVRYRVNRGDLEAMLRVFDLYDRANAIFKETGK